jgi:DNA replication protein DnaC
MTPDHNNHYRQNLQYLQYEGRKRYGIDFKFIKEDIPIILQLICYFINDKENAKEHQLDLQKGLLITGPVGCGKTTLLELMKLIAVPEKKFFFFTCREIGFEFIQDGYQVIHLYSKGVPNQRTRSNMAFDDLGTEQTLKYFGNETNVMAEILLSRYDLYIQNGLTTHITTNLSATELEDAYGNRVRSRLKKMCNLIAFDKETGDKR